MVDDAHGLGVIGESGKGTAPISGCLMRSIWSWEPFQSRWPLSEVILRQARRCANMSGTIPVPSFLGFHAACLLCGGRKRSRCSYKQPELPKRLCELANYMRNALRAKKHTH